MRLNPLGNVTKGTPRVHCIAYATFGSLKLGPSCRDLSIHEDRAEAAQVRVLILGCESRRKERHAP